MFYIRFDCEPDELERTLLSTLSISSKEFKIDYRDSSSCLVGIPMELVQKIDELRKSNDNLIIMKYAEYKRLDEVAESSMKNDVKNQDAIQQQSSNAPIDESNRVKESGLTKSDKNQSPRSTKTLNSQSNGQLNSSNQNSDSKRSSKRPKPVFEENTDGCETQ